MKKALKHPALTTLERAKAKRMLAAGRSLAVISTSLREAGRKCSCKGATKTRAGGWCPAVRNFLARSSR